MKKKMRSEKEMLRQILDIAQKDDRVRGVYMNGSRANPKVEKDNYQDFDIVFVVTETQSFIGDKSWLSQFGELAMVQQPDCADFGWGQDKDVSRKYTWLMLLKDHNRIDLTVRTWDSAVQDYLADSLCIKLIDKDNRLPHRPLSGDQQYRVKRPTRQEYDGCCNEFWWCLNNVAKGIVRDQLSYGFRMYHETVQAELEKMMAWYIGMEHSFAVSVGMWGKYFKKYLSTELYEQYVCTFCGGNYKSLWEAIKNACALFEKLALQVGDGCGFRYNEKDAANMQSYLAYMQRESQKKEEAL